MDTNQQILAQEIIEGTYNRRHIDTKIRKVIESHPLIQSKVLQGIDLINKYLQGTYYDSKMKRVAQLKLMDIRELVIDIFIGITYFQAPELFTSASAQLAMRLKFSNQVEAIAATADLLAVLCNTDAFDITKESKGASLKVVSRIPIEDSLVSFIKDSEFLPPMVCAPLPLTHNFSSGYLTHNDSLVLGTGNHHDGDLCLSVLNTMGQVAMKLDTEFLLEMEETPNYKLDTADKISHWQDFKQQSSYFYILMLQQGNRIYFNHKVDKRGRIYASGYHINPMGTSYKKAMLEFANEELTEGVPL